MASTRHSEALLVSYHLLASLLLFAYAIELNTVPLYSRILLACVALLLSAASIFRRFETSLWCIALTLLAQQLFTTPFLVANHHYCLFYLVLGLLMASAREADDRLSFLATNARLLAAVIMGFAVLHKIFSPSYMNGDYIGFMWAKGSYFAPFTPFVAPSIEKIVESNLQSLVAFRALPPSTSAFVKINAPFPLFDTMVWLTVWAILAAEFLAALFLLAFPKAIGTLLLNGGVVLLIAIARQEFVFLSYFFLLLALSTGGISISANVILLGASGVLSLIQILSILS